MQPPFTLPDDHPFAYAERLYAARRGLAEAGSTPAGAYIEMQINKSEAAQRRGETAAALQHLAAAIRNADADAAATAQAQRRMHRETEEAKNAAAQEEYPKLLKEGRDLRNDAKIVGNDPLVADLDVLLAEAHAAAYRGEYALAVQQLRHCRAVDRLPERPSAAIKRRDAPGR